MTDTGFVSARRLSAGFHDDVIRPLLGETPYAAGLLGWGSDVLGYDTERSTDHGWGPRLHLLVDAAEVERVTELIDGHLPTQYRGYDVRFGWDSQEPVHHITVKTVGGWLNDQLGRDVSDGMTTEDWLITPQQELLGVVAGPVYADDGRLERIRQALSWYPEDVWRWLLACQWSRIAQEEAFVQRTAEVGDELGAVRPVGVGVHGAADAGDEVGQLRGGEGLRGGHGQQLAGDRLIRPMPTFVLTHR